MRKRLPPAGVLFFPAPATGAEPPGVIVAFFFVIGREGGCVEIFRQVVGSV